MFEYKIIKMKTGSYFGYAKVGKLHINMVADTKDALDKRMKRAYIFYKNSEYTK